MLIARQERPEKAILIWKCLYVASAIQKPFIMRFLIFPAIPAFLFSSCSEKASETTSTTPEIPKVLDDNQKKPLFYKRQYTDLVDALYKELESADSTLSNVASTVIELLEEKEEVENNFNKFDAKNKSYYNDASIHIDKIYDSAIKKNTSLVMQQHQASYFGRIWTTEQLISRLESKNKRLNDLLVVLKLTRTMAVMEEFQKNQLPSTKDFISLEQKFDKTISDIEKLKE